MQSVMKHYGPKFEFFKKIVQKDDPVILEIGAHFGEDTLRFLETFPQGHIHCFEPDPRCIKVFRRYVTDPRATLHEVALSNCAGVATFYQSYQQHSDVLPPAKYDWIDATLYKEEHLNNSGSSSLKKGYQFNKKEAIEVVTQRFDAWCEKEDAPQEIDLAWIDVQGAEKDVLDGMGTEIRRLRLVWIEYGEMIYEDSMSRDETIEYFDSKGFSLVPNFSTPGPAGDLLFLRRGNV